MAIKIALAGNPNCGKTTMFNALTGANQYVGNWPGVTVEKKEGSEISVVDAVHIRFQFSILEVALIMHLEQYLPAQKNIVLANAAFGIQVMETEPEYALQHHTEFHDNH